MPDPAEDDDNDSAPVEDTGADAGQPASKSKSTAFGASISAEYSRKYGFDAKGATRITARIVALPPPTILLERLGASRDLIDEIQSRTPDAEAGPRPQREELSGEDEQWVEFGTRWLDALAPVLEQIDELREVYLGKGDQESTDVAGMLDVLKVVLQRFPDSDEKVTAMRTFLETDDVIKAAEADESGVEVTIKATMLPVLNSAP